MGRRKYVVGDTVEITSGGLKGSIGVIMRNTTIVETDIIRDIQKNIVGYIVKIQSKKEEILKAFKESDVIGVEK